MKSQLENFDVNDIKSFDVKDYILKVISHWKLFLVMLILGLFIAFFVNKRKQRIYSLNSLITVKEEQNPLFTSSTNIAFNWGGPSDKVETIINVLKSRTHNEKVVKKLKYYIDYLIQGDYRLEDAYGKVPFEIKLDTNSYNILSVAIKIELQKNGKLIVSADFEPDNKYTLANYYNDTSKSYTPSESVISKEFSLGEVVELPFCSFKLVPTEINSMMDREYFVRFNSFNGTVRAYQGISARTKTKGTSLIELELKGSNKKRIEDFINTTVEVLDYDQKDQKIQYAIRTKEYIDEVFDSASVNLSNIEKELGDYRRKNNVYDLSTEGQTLLVEASELDKKKQEIQGRLQYFNSLESYINSNSIKENVPVPVNLGLEDMNIAKNISEYVELSKEKKILKQTVTEDFPKLKAINDRIETTRNVVLENLKNLKKETNTSLQNVNSRIGRYNYNLSKLPKKEQGLLTLKRTQGITAANYEYLKQKQYEAGTAIAANVSDIKILDKAKDVGQTPISPNTKFNYLIAAMLSFGIPFLYILIKEALNNKILTVEELERMFEIPVLGVIGSSKLSTYLAVFNSPKSSIAESFRALRSNIQFLFKKGNNNSKTLVVTSSVSGEGKTLTSINMATVFAMSDKKTILLGLDLRKPKLHKDFDIDNEVGIVNYLIGQKEKSEIIRKTQIPNLDIITSGPVPPNPSELLLSDQTNDLMNYLKENYDYIVIDTPPVGLVADAIELFKYADATMYIVRQNYTQKGMPKMIDDKYINGELKNISFVLNDFSINKGYGYGGYNYGYGYGGYGKYGNGYHLNTKETPWYKKIFKK